MVQGAQDEARAAWCSGGGPHRITAMGEEEQRLCSMQPRGLGALLVWPTGYAFSSHLEAGQHGHGSLVQIMWAYFTYPILFNCRDLEALVAPFSLSDSLLCFRIMVFCTIANSFGFIFLWHAWGGTKLGRPRGFSPCILLNTNPFIFQTLLISNKACLMPLPF